MRRAHLTASAFALTVVACAPEARPVVICHNSNCIEPANPEEDDTVPALEASLGLEADGTPLIDGVEIDTFFDGAGERCLFAHDLEKPGEYPKATVAADVINDHLGPRAAGGGALTFSGAPFQVFIELKGHVAIEKSAKHTPEQRRLHAQCAVDVYTLLADAAAAEDRPLRVVFTSFDAALLAATQEILSTVPPREGVTTALGALFGIPPPLDSVSQALSTFADVPIEVVSVHPHWTRQGMLSAFASQDLEVGYWMFSAVPETLQAIDIHQPSFVTTSEARMLRSWIDR